MRLYVAELDGHKTMVGAQLHKADVRREEGMKRIAILVLLMISARAFAIAPEIPPETGTPEQPKPACHEANWLYVPAAALMTWGVYELGERSGDGWTYVGAYWGTAAVVSIGITAHQHFKDRDVTLNAGQVGGRPGVFLACGF